MNKSSIISAFGQPKRSKKNHRRLQRNLVISVMIHFAIITLAVLIPSEAAKPPVLEGNAINVDVVILDSGENTEPVELTSPVEQEDSEPEEQITEEIVETIEENPPEQEDYSTQETLESPEVEEIVEEQDSASEQFAGISSEGNAVADVPGPASYEGRVFGAIRRNFRTSVQPLQSYRIQFIVNPDGSTEVTTFRTSGVEAFDRAVESAIRLANIPPFPSGRTESVALNIEFLGYQ